MIIGLIRAANASATRKWTKAFPAAQRHSASAVRNEETESLPFGWRLLERVGLAALIALAGASPSLAAGQPSVPAWLEAHVGEGEGQIAPVVLERARALYQRKGVRNPCYFAFDATRPHDLGGAGAPILHHLRSPRIVSRDLRRPRRRAGPGRACGFLQRTAVREKFRQRDGLPT